MKFAPVAIAFALWLSLVTSSVLGAPQGGLPPEKRLNVLFIASDQHNARALGCAGNGYGGAPVSMTPALDQLADEGIRFETALVPQPQCSPTRYSYFTGQWPHHHGLRWNGVWEPRGIATLPRLARKAGYETAVIGKHHMHWLEQTPITEDLGFNQVVDIKDYRQFVIQSGQSIWTGGGNYFGMPNLPLALAFYTGFTLSPNDFHPDGYFANQTIDFLEARAADDKPFLCYWMPLGPHTPLTPTGSVDPEDWAHRFHPFANLVLPPNQGKVATTARLATSQNIFATISPDEWREVLSYYYGLIAQIDYNIGRVLDRLEQLGLADNTLVIYTSDHGEMSAEMSAWQKGTGSYDAITRVPLIMRLPDVILSGQVSEELVTTLDLIPTIFELTGIPIENEVRAKLGGESLVDITRGNVPADWRTEVFSEFGTSRVTNILRTRMVRTTTHKYSFDELGGGQEEFYDMVNDPFEIDNLINSQDPVVQASIADLRTRLDRWWNYEIGHAPQYLNTGESNELPTPPAEPFPADGSLGVARDVNPTWLASTSAVSQRVYVGSQGSNLKFFSELPGTENTINPGTLLGSRNFFWRVDQINQNGTTVGPVWHFRVEPGASVAPSLASPLFPPHRALGTGLNPKLQWKHGKGAKAQALFFGVQGDLRPTAKLKARIEEFQLGPLLADTTYEWRVDSIRNSARTEGDVWRFTTNAIGLPRTTLPIHPQHMDESAIVQAGVGLSWVGVPGTQTEYDVYFGQSLPLEFMGRQAITTFDPGPLGSTETYYWRIDSVNHRGVVPGFTWRFTTAP